MWKLSYPQLEVVNFQTIYEQCITFPEFTSDIYDFILVVTA